MSRLPALLALAAALPVGLAACGGSSSSTHAAAAPTTTTIPKASGATGGGYQRPPGTSGTIAAVTASASSMEVQSPSIGEVTVLWTSSTTFSNTTTVPLSSIATGSCVTVSGTKQGTSGITARSVTVSPRPSSGSCTSGRFGGFGGSGSFRRPSGNYHRPSGSTPRSLPAGAANTAIATGTVTATSGSGLTVSGHLLGFHPGAAGSTSTSTTVPATTTITVSLASGATVTSTAKGSSADLVVGRCATAIGTTASNGSVTARTISVRPEVDGSCTAGFGGGFFGGYGGGSGGSAPSGSASA